MLDIELHVIIIGAFITGTAVICAALINKYGLPFLKKYKKNKKL